MRRNTVGPRLAATVRMDPPLHAALADAATKNYRTLAQEIVKRLVESLAAEEKND